MPLIIRELSEQVLNHFSAKQKKGLILAGIVGSGKTTLVKMCLENLRSHYQVYEYTGDDAKFRQAVATDTKFFTKDIGTKNYLPVLIFVDEVQKSENIFDALKYSFDHSEFSFIVSGSNPHYLKTVARKRLQRRAEFLILHPFSIIELIDSENIWNLQKLFLKFLLFKEMSLDGVLSKHISEPENLSKLINQYFIKGGLPLSQKDSVNESLSETRLIFERGFEPIRNDSEDILDLLAIELAELHAKEFTYQNIFRKVKSTNRSLINTGIENLVDHGYLNLVSPYLFDSDKKTYLKKYFYVDPGLVTYLTGEVELKHNKGYKNEGYLFTRLHFHLQNVPIKNKGVFFYKPYKTRPDGAINFQEGEMDAILKIGSEVIFIESKSSSNWTDIDTTKLENTLNKFKSNLGIIMYEGLPKYMPNKKILFWPIWAL